MTTTTKSVLGIVAIAVIAIGGSYVYMAHNSQTPVAATNGTGLPTTATDTSDGAIQLDAAAIDSEIKATDDDDATVDQGIQTHSQTQ